MAIFDKCQKESSDDVFCCFMINAFEKIGLFINGELVPQGLITALSASVDFDTAWMYIIDNSVNRCFDSSNNYLRTF